LYFRGILRIYGFNTQLSINFGQLHGNFQEKQVVFTTLQEKPTRCTGTIVERERERELNQLANYFVLCRWQTNTNDSFVYTKVCTFRWVAQLVALVFLSLFSACSLNQSSSALAYFTQNTGGYMGSYAIEFVSLVPLCFPFWCSW